MNINSQGLKKNNMLCLLCGGGSNSVYTVLYVYIEADDN